MSDERIIHVTTALSWINLRYDLPYTGWSSANFINDGPSAVEASVNYPDVNKFVLTPGKPVRYDKEPINIIYFKAFPGLRATVRIIGG